MVLTCYVIAQDHVIKVSHDFMGKLASRKFGGHSRSDSGNIFLVCHMISSSLKIN